MALRVFSILNFKDYMGYPEKYPENPNAARTSRCCWRM
jgi:hypothetical protein